MNDKDYKSPLELLYDRKAVHMERLPMSDIDLEQLQPNEEDPAVALIRAMATQAANDLDDAVMRAVMNVGITVDRDELVKALQYDRDQYNKGFEAGVAFAHTWYSVEERLPELDMTKPDECICLIWCDDGVGYDIGYYTNENLFSPNGIGEPHWIRPRFGNVVAWMPLPEPFRKEDVNGKI